MHNYAPSNYPLDRELFRHAITVGHGRAKIHVNRYGTREVRDEILEAATSCKVYDPQVEGLPVTWIADLCVAADLVREVVAKQPTGPHWDRKLRCALLKEFASRGDLDARTALYSECQRVAGVSDIYGSFEIIDLDGEAGFLFIVQKLGELATTQLDFLSDDSAVRDFEEQHGEGTGLAFLRNHANVDPAVASYIRALESFAMRGKDQQRPPRPTVTEVLAQISTAERSLHWLGHWGRHASSEELEPILALVEQSSSPRILENALRCLSGSRSPPFHSALFDLLRHQDANVRLFATRSLANSVQPSIREEGLAALSFDVTMGLALLRKNARAEDARALMAALRPVSDVDLQHSLVSGAVDLLKQNGIVREPGIALYVYENSPCMNCRGDAVKLLLDWGSCPPWLRDEGAFDASEEIRAACYHHHIVAV